MSELGADLATRIRQKHRASAVVDRYWSNPALFALECFRWPEGQSLAPYQEEILRRLVTDFRVAGRGPRGYGKSASFALATCWFAATREMRGVPWKIVSTAGAWSQLRDYLWPEIHLWAGRMKWEVLGLQPWREGRELLATGLKLSHGVATSANPKVSARIEGGHAEQFLYIFDEAKLIPTATWESAEGSASSTTGGRELRWLAQSSGGDADGRFYDLHMGKFGGWWTRHVKLEEAVAAGRVSAAWADSLRRDFGETSPFYQNHALGNFSKTGGENTVIRLSDVERAFERWREWKEGGGRLVLKQTSLGVDVGTGNLDRDPATIARRTGCVITALDLYRFSSKHPEMELAGIVAGLLEAGGVAVVDAIGQGSGVVSRLRETRPGQVVPFVASADSSTRDKSGADGFLNLRAEAWWGLREWFADPDSDLALPEDPRTLHELTLPSWKISSNARIQIEAKDEIARRLRKLESRHDEGGSTNRADAIVQACWRGAVSGEIDAGSIVAGEAEVDAPDVEWG